MAEFLGVLEADQESGFRSSLYEAMICLSVSQSERTHYECCLQTKPTELFADAA